MSAKQKTTAKATPATSTGVANIAATIVAGARPLPQGLILKRRITLPTLAMKNAGEVRYLVIADAMRVSKVKDKPMADGRVKDPATICTVGDVLTGEVFTWIVPAVCKANLQQEYPDDTYVGKCFMVEHLGRKKEGQRYADFALAEVDASGLTKQAQDAQS